MPQITNITINDGQATPGAHTYVPRDIRNGVAELVETNGVPIGENRLTMSLRKTPTGRWKYTQKLVLPIVQNATVNGIVSPTVVRTGYVTVECDFAETSTTAERKDATTLTRNSLGTAIISALTNDLQNVY